MKLERGFFESARLARVCLISGLNAIHDVHVLQERLQELVAILATFPQEVTVFYEDACYHKAHFRHVVLQALSPLIGIFSLNEDELQGYLGRKLNLLDPGQVLEAIQALRVIIPVPVLVVHAQRWALASGQDSGQFSAALKNGVAMAATRFRLGDGFTREDFQATLALAPNGKGEVFAREIIRRGKGGICCVPSVELEERKVTTIGLGDAFVGGFLSTWAR